MYKIIQIWSKNYKKVSNQPIISASSDNFWELGSQDPPLFARLEMGSGEGEGGLFLRFRLVYILIPSFLLSLEPLEKFAWWSVCKPILVFSLSLSQA